MTGQDALERLPGVLGTPVFRWPQPCARALLVSDLHVPVDGGAVFERLGQAIDVALREAMPLLVLGDLFDSYIARAQVRVGVFRDTARRFARAADAGVPVVLLHGNRDFLLGPEFVAASRACLVPGALRIELGGVPTLLAHGDEFCVRDLPYQRAKRWLRHPVTRWIARRLPLAAAMAVAERARRRSRQVVASGDQSRFLPTGDAVAQAFANGVERLVFGHIHRRCEGTVGGGGYRVLPAFDGTGVGLLADGEGLHWVEVAGGGRLEPVGAAPACPFAA